jgi:hypothetical protein
VFCFQENVLGFNVIILTPFMSTGTTPTDERTRPGAECKMRRYDE